MTKEEIRKFLDNTKVYVNGKSKEIQEKLFSFGYKWNGSGSTDVHNTGKPFLLISKNRDITYEVNMNFFVEHENKEITADEILSLEVTEPSYRPFKSQDECWNEMQKHQPFGWFHHKYDNCYEPIRAYISRDTQFEGLFNTYNFADGTPFGIKEE